MGENNVNKQLVSESRRRESVKLRQREKSSQQKQISDFLRKSDLTSKSSNVIKFTDDGDVKADNVSITKDIPTKISNSSNKSKMLLLESSSSEDEQDDDETRFKIKPQFEGERGRQLFEMSSSIMDERFRLDERFKEAEDMEKNIISETEEFGVHDKEDSNDEDKMSLKQEKGKNLAILEQILGIKMPPKPPQGEQAKKRKYVRFDPESEGAEEYIKKSDEDKNKAESKKKKKIEAEKEPEPLPVVSKERFYHVSEDLKEVLGSSEPFSFASRFNFSQDAIEEKESQEYKISASSRTDDAVLPEKEKELRKLEKVALPTESQVSETEQTQRVTFFFRSGDPRLQEGIEFFRRNKPKEELQKQWFAKRSEVVDMLKRNRKVALKKKVASKTLQQQKYGKKPFGKKKFNKISR